MGFTGGAQNGVFIEIAFQSVSRADIDGHIRQTYMEGIGIGIRVNSHGFNVQFLTGTDNADGDFATISNKNAFEHRITS